MWDFSRLLAFFEFLLVNFFVQRDTEELHHRFLRLSEWISIILILAQSVDEELLCVFVLLINDDSIDGVSPCDELLTRLNESVPLGQRWRAPILLLVSPAQLGPTRLSPS